MNYRDLSERDKQSTVLSRLDDARVAIENMPTGGGDFFPGCIVNNEGTLLREGTEINVPSNIVAVGAQALQYAFSSNASLKTVEIASIKSLKGRSAMSYAFDQCPYLETVTFKDLEEVIASNALGNTFNYCMRLKDVYFPKLTNAIAKGGFSSMLTNVTGCKLHFKAGTESVIEALTGYPNFGGTNTTVLFDL